MQNFPSANGSSNVLLTVALVVLAYGVWSLVTTVSAPPDPWTILLCIGLLFAVTIFAALFLRFPAKLEIAFILAALIIGNAIINHVFFSFTGLSVTSIIDSKIRAIDTLRRNETEAARRAASGIGEGYFFSSQPVATRKRKHYRQGTSERRFFRGERDPPAGPTLALDRFEHDPAISAFEQCLRRSEQSSQLGDVRVQRGGST